MDLHSSRDAVRNYFEKMSKSRGIVLNISEASEKELNTLDRIFESYDRHRGIIIELGYDSLDFDFFTKLQIRYDGQVELLYIITRRPKDDISKLWNMYCDWMHMGNGPDYLEEHYKRV